MLSLQVYGQQIVYNCKAYGHISAVSYDHKSLSVTDEIKPALQHLGQKILLASIEYFGHYYMAELILIKSNWAAQNHDILPLSFLLPLG